MTLELSRYGEYGNRVDLEICKSAPGEYWVRDKCDVVTIGEKLLFA